MGRQTVNVAVLAETSRFVKGFSNASKSAGGFTDGMKKAAGGVGKVALGAGVAVAGIGAAIGVLALKGGFSRALKIQEAQTQLKGLGYDTKTIDKVMTNALAAVKGTAFGLGDAATIASSAMASGIKPGQDLERTLKLTADAATIAKVPLNEMGSMWNKVAAQGKLNTEVMNQFSDRGVPVLQYVAKQYGVTAAEAQKMVTSGKVSFEDFQDIMQKNLGGAALSSGDTFAGAMANMKAALGRLGAQFATPIVTAAPKFFQALGVAIDGLGPVLKPISDAFAATFLPLMDRLSTSLAKIDFGAVFGKIGGIVRSLTPLGRVAASVSPLGTVLAFIGKNANQVGPILGTLAKVISGALSAALPIVVQLVGALAKTFSAILPAVAQLARTLGSALVQVIVALAPLLVLVAR
ncbi:MAG: hypothetical protein JWP75_3888, partial [Frondihabitans sp.]|nr:hypothetical protein [Frondihabitans sp.]